MVLQNFENDGTFKRKMFFYWIIKKTLIKPFDATPLGNVWSMLHLHFMLVGRLYKKIVSGIQICYYAQMKALNE